MTPPPYTVTLIPGDGTGPEVIAAATSVLEATGVALRWEEAEAGETAIARHGTHLPEATLDSIRRNRVALKGPVTTPVGTGFRSVNVALRQTLDLYACLRPCRTYHGVRSPYEDVDIVVVRENTEDLYAGIEFQRGTPEAEAFAQFLIKSGAKVRTESGFSVKPISVEGSRRIAKFAFDYARANDRRKVTAVHKANIMKFSDGLFLEVVQEVSRSYADIAFDSVIVDNLCMQLVQRPQQFDVLVLPNLYGDIVSDLCAGLVGGLGVAPGANFGEGIAVFEPTHGSAPKYAGLDKVNPTAAILSGVMMLHHLGEHGAAVRVERAVARVIAEGHHVTYDLRPRRDDPKAVGTKEMAQAIIKVLKK
ncbi:MAG: isocitrate/isopropylmalate dehydrogenase family protein [Chloroflexi bacterium]|nr:isocitrate/isopropylmalate dehydrogenase family protein [Chloroflexota bacterium]